MKRILIAVILALGLLLVSSGVSAASGIQVVDKTGDGVWTDDTWQVEMFPGESKSTTIGLHNSSGSSLDVEVTVTPNSQDDGNLTFELDKSSFEMSGKSDSNVTLTVKASGSATPGTYTTELEIKSEVIPTGGGGGGGAGPADRTPPRIYSATLCGIAETTADICWTTNEWSTSQIEYWTSPSKFSPLDETRVIKHRVHLTDLTPGTDYYYKMMSEDKAGNLRVSDKHSFTTLGEAPKPITPAPTPTPTPEPTPPEVIEPEEVEPIIPPYIPPEEPKPETPWGLIAAVAGIVVLAAVGGIVYWRKRKGESHW